MTFIETIAVNLVSKTKKKKIETVNQQMLKRN